MAAAVAQSVPVRCFIVIIVFAFLNFQNDGMIVVMVRMISAVAAAVAQSVPVGCLIVINVFAFKHSQNDGMIVVMVRMISASVAAAVAQSVPFGCHCYHRHDRKSA